MVETIFTLLMLVVLQAVLGFDNLLYISLISKRLPSHQQNKARRWGIALAIVLRIALLFALIQLIQMFEQPFITFQNSWVKCQPNLHALLILLGGAFILYTSVKEIWHISRLQFYEKVHKKSSYIKVLATIIVMNLVFSFDSILSAMALTKDPQTGEYQFWVMAAAILLGGVLMLALAGRIAEFLEKNRLYEVLGLFILFLVGIMLITEGGHLAQLSFFGRSITPMSKTTFYFVLIILVLIDIVQARFQKKIAMQKKDEV